MRKVVKRTTASVVAAILGTGLAGCAGEPQPVEWPDDPPPWDASERPSLPDDSAEAVATTEILTLVRDFRELEVAAYADPQPPHLAERQLSAYLADPLLSRTLRTLDTMRRAGIVFEGRPTWEPTVAELRLEATPPAATIRDCVDASGWRSVFEETGDLVPTDDLPEHYVMRLRAKQFPDGWLLHDAAMEEDTQC